LCSFCRLSHPQTAKPSHIINPQCNWGRGDAERTIDPERVELTYLGFEIMEIINPITGENIIEMKKDHSSPMRRYLPSFSDTTREKMYQAEKMAVNQ
jgi:hypothetical protein